MNCPLQDDSCAPGFLLGACQTQFGASRKNSQTRRNGFRACQSPADASETHFSTLKTGFTVFQIYCYASQTHFRTRRFGSHAPGSQPTTHAYHFSKTSDEMLLPSDCKDVLSLTPALPMNRKGKRMGANESFHSIALIRLHLRLASGDQIAGLGGSWILSQENAPPRPKLMAATESHLKLV